MTDFLLLLLGLTQIIQIILTLILIRAINAADFSKENAALKDATQKAQDELSKFPPKKN